MKHVQLFLATALAVVLAGCGGSSTSSGSKVTGVTTAPHIEAVVVTPTSYDTQTVGTSTYSFIYQDPLNIEANDVVQFQLVDYTVVGTSATRNVLPAVGWTSSDSGNVYGTLAYDSGLFTASTNETFTSQTVQAIYNNVAYSALYRIQPHQVRLRGVLLAHDTSIPLAGVQIQFFGPQNPDDPSSPTILVGSVTTSFNGTFRASIPDSTTEFQLVNASLPTGYQRYFMFEGANYQTGNDSCHAPLGTAFSNGERTLIDSTNADPTTNGTILVYSTAETTPTNLNCSGG